MGAVPLTKGQHHHLESNVGHNRKSMEVMKGEDTWENLGRL